MLRGVLFDLDGTLLKIDLRSFFRTYFAALGPVIADIIGAGSDVSVGLNALLVSTEQMSISHPGVTNQEVLYERFSIETGTDLRDVWYAEALNRFYTEDFPAIRGSDGPVHGGRHAVETALELGLCVAIATHPIFPEAAIRERMRWAGVDDLPVHVVTSYEMMHATKPDPAYFAETCALLGVNPREAIMVGDDRQLDLAASDIGIRTFYVGKDRKAVSDWRGTLEDLARLLPRLIREGR
jgi:FMN phosphatase YigB (HAD superfamily)